MNNKNPEQEQSVYSWIEEKINSGKTINIKFDNDEKGFVSPNGRIYVLTEDQGLTRLDEPNKSPYNLYVNYSDDGENDMDPNYSIQAYFKDNNWKYNIRHSQYTGKLTPKKKLELLVVRNEPDSVKVVMRSGELAPVNRYFQDFQILKRSPAMDNAKRHSGLWKSIASSALWLNYYNDNLTDIYNTSGENTIIAIIFDNKIYWESTDINEMEKIYIINSLQGSNINIFLRNGNILKDIDLSSQNDRVDFKYYDPTLLKHKTNEQLDIVRYTYMEDDNMKMRIFLNENNQEKENSKDYIIEHKDYIIEQLNTIEYEIRNEDRTKELAECFRFLLDIYTYYDIPFDIKKNITAKVLSFYLQTSETEDKKEKTKQLNELISVISEQISLNRIIVEEYTQNVDRFFTELYESSFQKEEFIKYSIDFIIQILLGPQNIELNNVLDLLENTFKKIKEKSITKYNTNSLFIPELDETVYRIIFDNLDVKIIEEKWKHNKIQVDALRKKLVFNVMDKDKAYTKLKEISETLNKLFFD